MSWLINNMLHNRHSQYVTPNHFHCIATIVYEMQLLPAMKRNC